MCRKHLTCLFLIIFLIEFYCPRLAITQETCQLFCEKGHPRVRDISCAEILSIVNFDYPANINIGKHRKCRSGCQGWDLDCQAQKLDCERIKGSQIVAGVVYQTAIFESKIIAANSGISKIPQEIKGKLKHLFPAYILDKARYTFEKNLILPVCNLPYFAIHLLDMSAITLDDIIVFANDVDISSKLHLWAHELEHVVQYDQLGLDGFAQAYLFENGLLENWANRKADLVCTNNLRCIKNCISPIPVNLVIENRVLDIVEDYEARNNIIIGPNVTLGANGNVTLRAGNRIKFNQFRSTPGGKLRAVIDPSLKE